MWLHYSFLLCVLLGVTIVADVVEIRSIYRTSSIMLRGGQSSAVREVDSGLYSRQLLVLGMSGQLAIHDAHVLVVGDGTLASEVAKNLALAGVGKLSLASTLMSQSGNTCHAGVGLENYAKGLNNGIKVRLVLGVVKFLY